MKGFKKAMNEDEKGNDKSTDDPQARVSHDDEGTTYDVKAERKAEEQDERK